MKKLRVGIIGAGRMGRIRALSAMRHPGCEVAGVADTSLSQAEFVAAEAGCAASADWTALIRRDDIDAVAVATPHKFLAPISVAALEEGKHVLCEKPGARTPAEVETMLRVLYAGWSPEDAARFPRIAGGRSARLAIGFTLRHHRAIARARELLGSGEIGKPMYIIGRYGHGGRPGYEKEWRHEAELSGGGELLDQGVHLIDLSRWFLGEFAEVTGYVGNYVWGSSVGPASERVEDNAFLLLRSVEGRVASLQASWTQWKNLFSLELHGENGFLHVQGLGGSYGPEKLSVGRRRPQGGAPDMHEVDLFAGAAAEPVNGVWDREWEAFVDRALDREDPVRRVPASESASAIDAWEALRIVEAAYTASRISSAVPLAPALAARSDRALLAGGGAKH